MPRAENYVTDDLATPGDKFLMSNGVDGKTRNMQLSQVEEYILGLKGDRKIPIEAKIDFTTAEPSPLVDGNRYINTVSGISNLTNTNVLINNIYEVRGGILYEIQSLVGWTVFDKSLDLNISFNGTIWRSDVAASTTVVENVLTSVSTTKALSANQGKVLKEGQDAIISNYGPPLQSIVQLAALTEASLTDKERHYVEDNSSDYFYDAQANSGDVAPSDQTGGTGFWKLGVVPALVPITYTATKTVGGVTIGDTITKDTLLNDVIKNIIAPLILPTFIVPTSSLSATILPTTVTEIGTTIAPDLTGVLTVNDGGTANQYIINKDAVAILTNAILNHIINTFVLSATPVIFQAVINYNAGTAPKNDSLGNPVANTIVAGSANSNILSYRGYYKIFYGPVAAPANSSATVRALANNRFENAGNVFNLVTGSTEVNFQFWLPTGKNLVSVIDLDALNANITASYVTSALSVNDAGGTPVTGTLYTLTQGVPYSTSHNHQITIA